MHTIDTSRLDLRDAVDLAIQIGEDARRRYVELAARVGGRYAGDADEVFRTMAELEERHEQRLADRRRRVFGDVPPRIVGDALDEVEPAELGAIRVFMGPRDAVRVALDAEKRAFEFYDSASRHAVDPAVRIFFEEQRADQADHCRTLEAWLRAAPGGPDLEEDEADPPGSDAG